MLDAPKKPAMPSVPAWLKMYCASAGSALGPPELVWCQPALIRPDHRRGKLQTLNRLGLVQGTFGVVGIHEVTCRGYLAYPAGFPLHSPC